MAVLLRPGHLPRLCCPARRVRPRSRLCASLNHPRGDPLERCAVRGNPSWSLPCSHNAGCGEKVRYLTSEITVLTAVRGRGADHGVGRATYLYHLVALVFNDLTNLCRGSPNCSAQGHDIFGEATPPLSRRARPDRGCICFPGNADRGAEEVRLVRPRLSDWAGTRGRDDRGPAGRWE